MRNLQCDQPRTIFLRITFASTFLLTQVFFRPLSRYPNRKLDNSVPRKGASELVDVEIAEDAPKAVPRGVLGEEEARVFEEEPDIGELGLEFGEEDGE